MQPDALVALLHLVLGSGPTFSVRMLLSVQSTGLFYWGSFAYCLSLRRTYCYPSWSYSTCSILWLYSCTQIEPLLPFAVASFRCVNNLVLVSRIFHPFPVTSCLSPLRLLDKSNFFAIIFLSVFATGDRRQSSGGSTTCTVAIAGHSRSDEPISKAVLL